MQIMHVCVVGWSSERTTPIQLFFIKHPQKTMKKIVMLVGFLAASFWAHAQATYNTYDQLSTRLKGLAAKYPDKMKVSSIGKSAGGKDIWVVSLAENPTSPKPAVLLIAGLNGEHLAGVELSVATIEKWMNSANATELLKSKTVYVIPAGSPDILDALAAKVKGMRSTNATSTDGDRDGRIDEDPAEDINGDGLITLMRVEDPTGTFVPSTENPKVMVLADPEKKQVGKYIVLSEGIDNDKDGKWNEDGQGGVTIDKNFTFDYPIFEDGAGSYTASESETRAILDFLYLHPSIFATLTFGPANNLTTPIKFDKAKASKRIITGWLESDADVNAVVSKWYTKQVSEKNAPALPMTKGNFAQTAYYHAGRFSFSTPGWWVPADTAKKASAAKTPVQPEVDFLRWADAEKLTNVFVDWKEVKHPDFPGKKVEVGGLAPYALLNPPVSYLEKTAEQHQAFLTDLLGAMPTIQVTAPKVEAVSAGLTRVTVQVVNKGLLPTYASIGDKVRFVKKMKTTIELGKNQTLVSGKKMTLGSALKAGEMVEFSWLIAGNGAVKITSGCQTAGEQTVEVSIN